MPETPALLMNAESVLRWPIFRNSTSTSRVDSFVLDGMNFDDQDGGFVNEPVQFGLRAGRGVCEEDFTHLAQKFLAYVHVKNPILDIAEYKSYVSVAAENGPGWDGPSCIVVSSHVLASSCGSTRQLTDDVAHHLRIGKPRSALRIRSLQLRSRISRDNPHSSPKQHRSRSSFSLLHRRAKASWLPKTITHAHPVPLPIRRISNVLHQRHGGLVLLQSGLCAVSEFAVVSDERLDEVVGEFDECYEEVGAKTLLVLSQIGTVRCNRHPSLDLGANRFAANFNVRYPFHSVVSHHSTIQILCHPLPAKSYPHLPPNQP
jgi:hypothetical protein